jgi:hypothetical protein
VERGESQEPRSELPSPYRSPWRTLGENLAAVAADLRLRLRELLRRNRQGDLPVPGVWPMAAAALFWPLLLGLLLALAITAAVVLRPPHLSGQAPGPPALKQEPPAPAPIAERIQPSRESDTESPPPGQDAATPDSPLESTPPPLELDPLLALMTDEESAGMLLAASPDPASGTLRLTLSRSGLELAKGELLQRAEQWRQQALESGYERLELQDSQGRLLGRQALVGSGMILLAPTSPS